jgi:hypothetical protein
VGCEGPRYHPADLAGVAQLLVDEVHTHGFGRAFAEQVDLVGTNPQVVLASMPDEPLEAPMLETAQRAREMRAQCPIAGQAGIGDCTQEAHVLDELLDPDELRYSALAQAFEQRRILGGIGRLDDGDIKLTY